METLCLWMPHFAVKGQGCWSRALALTVTLVTYSLAGGQLQPSQGRDRPPASHILTQTLLSPPPSSADTSHTWRTVAQTHFDSSVTSSVPSPQQLTDIWDSSTFDFPAVTFFSTTTFSVDWKSFLSDEDILSSSSAFPETARDRAQQPLESSIEPTVFLDSVAASLRWNPAEEFSDSVVTAAPLFISTSAPIMGASVLEEPTRGVLLQAASTSAWDTPTLTPALTTGLQLESSAIEASARWSQGSMVPTNSTQSSAEFSLALGETVSSLMSSTAGVSSPGLEGGGNWSCTDAEAGCVEYKDREQDEEARIKIIVGVACAVLLLLVLVVVIVTCIMRRRGKISTGSKIDLSSYWDDNVTLSYINGHIDIPKDSADEMISLDNDSFLNSLDSMSFTNTWTSDASKHTNF